MGAPGVRLAKASLSVRHNVDCLTHATPVLSDVLARGTLRVVGGGYDLATGKVNLI